MIHEFEKPIPVITSIGDGYAIYVKENGPLENDEWCIIMKNGGQPLHFLSNQIRISKNATYCITPAVMPAPAAVDLDQMERPAGLPDLAEDLLGLGR